MQDSREKKQCLIFVRNNANDTADRIEAYAKKSGMKVVETIFNTDKKAVERLRYYIERDAIICVLVRDVVDISMELNEITHIPTTNISNNQYMIPAINAFGILVLICAAECPAAIVHPIKVCMNDAASWKNDLQSERNTSDCTA